MVVVITKDASLHPSRFSDRSVESRRKRVEALLWSHPSKLLDVIKKGDIGAQGGEGSEQQRLFSLAGQSRGKGTRIGCVHMPLAPIRGD